MPTLALSQLSGSLNQSLASLYVVHGEEDLLRLEAVDALRAAAKQQGYLNREVLNVDSGFEWGELMAAANSMGLFADLKLLEIHIPSGKPGKEGGDVLQALAERLPEDTVVLLVLPKLERTQTQSKWFGALARAGQIVEAKAVGQHELPRWISARLQAHGLSIEADALSLFAERVEGNLLAARQEIDKMALLHPTGTRLSLVDAQMAVANVARFDVFQLAAAWMGGDAPRLLRLLEGLEAEGDEPVLLLWAVSEDIRSLIRLKAGLAQGERLQSLSQSLRLWGEKQQLAPQALQRIGVRRLLAALQRCAQVDRQIKGAEAGPAWPNLKDLLLSLC